MSILGDKQRLEERQDEMQNRMARNSERIAVSKLLSKNEQIFCLSCNMPTTVDKYTGEIRLCKKCKRLKDSLLKYKLTIFEYRMILNDQDGKCAICRITFDDKDKKTTPCVDHCHELNHVRGFLCSNCNTGIGFLGDDSGVAENASKYLKRNMFRRAWHAED